MNDSQQCWEYIFNNIYVYAARIVLSRVVGEEVK